MAQINEEIEIIAPIAVVYHEWADLTQLPQILGIVDEVKILDSNMSYWKLSIAGKPKEYEAEITALVPESHISWQSVTDDEIGGNITFEAVTPEITKLHVVVNWEPEGIIENIGEAMNMDDGAVRSDLQKFKENLEAHQNER